jgi:thiamine phosphate synthase YjbQ (UPF0047 family)
VAFVYPALMQETLTFATRGPGLTDITAQVRAVTRHTAEGPDDMPAHIKTALSQVSLAIPIMAGRLALGTWQGIYLWEHRRAPHQRRVLVHISG